MKNIFIDMKALPKLITVLSTFIAFNVYGENTISPLSQAKSHSGGVSPASEKLVPALECGPDYAADQDTHKKIVNINKKFSQPRSVSELRNKALNCFVDFKRIFGLWVQNKVIVVDVRHSTQYAKFRIPNSINLPLYSIKAKTYLKDKTVLIVNEGVNQNSLVETCQSLSQAGYINVKVLDGGLRSWSQHAKLDGNELAISELKNLTAKELESAWDDHHWIIVTDKSGAGKTGELFKGATTLVFKNGSSAFISKLEKYSKEYQNNNDYAFLVVNSNGKNYSDLEDVMGKAGIKTDYYLEGGLNNFEKFLLSHRAMLTKAAIGPVRPKPCDG